MISIKFDPAENFYFQRGVSRRVAETGTSWPHYHGLFEIYFLLEGNCTYIIDNKVYCVQAGDLVMIPDGVIHHTKYDNLAHTRILVNCSKDYLPTSLLHTASIESYLYRNPPLTEEIKKIFGKIEQEYKRNDMLSDEIIACHVHSLFYLLARNADSCLPAEDGNKVIAQAVAYMKENFASDITLGALAKRFSVSAEHFSRKFKKETGLGFSKYLNTLRLQHAEQLLRSDPKQNITQIAFCCGFEDSNYFSKKFKEAYGTSPKKLQKQVKKDR